MRGESVVVYDADGRFSGAFGEEFRGGAHGLSLRREGDGEFLYHCDINRCKIVKTTLDGKTLWSMAILAKMRLMPNGLSILPDECRLCTKWRFLCWRWIRFASRAALFAERKFLGEIGRPGMETESSIPRTACGLILEAKNPCC